jgi:uncharacterized protein
MFLVLQIVAIYYTRARQRIQALTFINGGEQYFPGIIMNCMKYLVASDIHGSVDSLKVLIHKFSELKCDKIIFLGDYLSYSKDDEKVVDMLNFFKNDIIGVRGNCDYCLNDDIFDFELRDSFYMHLGTRNYLFVHGDNLLSNIEAMLGVENAYIVYGHTHRVGSSITNTINLVNIGSISLPCGLSKRCYGILDENNLKIFSLEDELILEV